MYNHFTNTEFQIEINKLPGVAFSSTKFTMPGISGTPVPVPSMANPIVVNYDKIEYSELQVDFLIDAEMTNYRACFDWIKGLGADKASSQYANLEDKYADVTVLMYNSMDNNTTTVKFYNALPSSLSDVLLSTNETDVIYPHATLMMAYDYYEFL